MRDFPRSVRVAAWTRANGHCEACGQPLVPGAIHYDHIVPHAIHPDNTLSNCGVLCRTCHNLKTELRDLPTIAKVKRVADKLRSARMPPKPLPAGRKSPLRKTLAGPVVPRLSQVELHREFMARRNQTKED